MTSVHLHFCIFDNTNMWILIALFPLVIYVSNSFLLHIIIFHAIWDMRGLSIEYIFNSTKEKLTYLLPAHIYYNWNGIFPVSLHCSFAHVCMEHDFLPTDLIRYISRQTLGRCTIKNELINKSRFLSCAYFFPHNLSILMGTLMNAKGHIQLYIAVTYLRSANHISSKVKLIHKGDFIF